MGWLCTWCYPDGVRERGVRRRIGHERGGVCPVLFVADVASSCLFSNCLSNKNKTKSGIVVFRSQTPRAVIYPP